MGLGKKADELIESPGQASSELVMQDLMDRDERIDLLIYRLETKYDRGNELQSKLELWTAKIKEQQPYWQRSGYQEGIDKASEELGQLSDEVDEINKELMDLSFSQGQMKRRLRHGAGMLGSSENPYDIEGDAGIAEQDLMTGRRQPSWNVENLFEPSHLEVAEASMIRELVIISNGLDSKGLVKEADIVDRVINSIISE